MKSLAGLQIDFLAIAIESEGLIRFTGLQPIGIEYRPDVSLNEKERSGFYSDISSLFAFVPKAESSYWRKLTASYHRANPY